MTAFFAEDLSYVLDIAALAAIFGSFLAYTRMKSALLASESAAKAWHEERDAEKARAERMAYDLKVEQEEKLKLLAVVASLETRPDLSRMERLVQEQLEAMRRHEKMAAERTDRLISAVDRLADGQRSAADALVSHPPTGTPLRELRTITPEEGGSK